jgi:transposase
MSQIPTGLTEKQFDQHVKPYLSKAKRGFVYQISLHKVFNYILYWLHTGCQWGQLPIDKNPVSEKKKSATARFITIFSIGVGAINAGDRVLRCFAAIYFFRKLTIT